MMARGTSNITVGAVIPTYNYAAGLRRAIDSVLAQTRPVDEIVVVNDGSTDETLTVVAAYGQRLRCVTQANGGAASARNRGVRELNTDWIAFLDQDDQWLPEKLERQCAALAKAPLAAFSFTGAHKFEDDEPVCVSVPDLSRIARNFRYRNCFGSASSYMIRRDAYLELGGFAESQKTYAEDWELAVRLYLRHPICAVAEPLIRYACTDTGASSNVIEMMNAELRMVETTLLEGLTGFNRFVSRRRLLSEIHYRAARNLLRSSGGRVTLVARSLLDWPLPLYAGPRLLTLASALIPRP